MYNTPLLQTVYQHKYKTTFQSSHLSQPDFLSAPANRLSSFSHSKRTILRLAPKALTNFHSSTSPIFQLSTAVLLLTTSPLVAVTASLALPSTRRSNSNLLSSTFARPSSFSSAGGGLLSGPGTGVSLFAATRASAPPCGRRKPNSHGSSSGASPRPPSSAVSHRVRGAAQS